MVAVVKFQGAIGVCAGGKKVLTLEKKEIANAEDKYVPIVNVK